MKEINTNKGMNMNFILIFFTLLLFTLMAQSEEKSTKHNITDSQAPILISQDHSPQVWHHF